MEGWVVVGGGVVEVVAGALVEGVGAVAASVPGGPEVGGVVVGEVGVGVEAVGGDAVGAPGVDGGVADVEEGGEGVAAWWWFAWAGERGGEWLEWVAGHRMGSVSRGVTVGPVWGSVVVVVVHRRFERSADEGCSWG